MSGSDLFLIMPEVILAVMGFFALMCGAFFGQRVVRGVDTLVIISFMLAGAAIFLPERQNHILQLNGMSFGFHFMLMDSAYTQFAKVMTLIAGGLAVIMMPSYNKLSQQDRPENSVLMLFAVLGMMLMISASDMLALYMGLELQSLSLYVLAASHATKAKSSEAGLKYFVLGALSSGLLLYGISLLYGYAGTTEFVQLALRLRDTTPVPTGIVVGMVFIIAAMAFKISAFPFHMWTPDVYEGAPTPVTAFFATAPKIAALVLMTRVLVLPLGGVTFEWMQILVFMAVASMLIGSLAGIMQSNIKRMMAYSSIANIGYALVAIVTHTTLGVQSLLIFLAIYFVNTLGIFAVLVCLKKGGKSVEDVRDLSGLAKTNPALAFGMLVLVFSMAGLPPFAGFFAKYFIFMAAVQSGMIVLATIGLLSTVLSVFFYLRIVKVMCFDPVLDRIDPVTGRGVRFVFGLAVLYMVVFTFVPAPIVNAAYTAAHSLLPQ